MKRDIEKLSKDEFDILVIGGGIHGITVAREAAKNGYKTALIEMNDFGHSTSFNSMKVIHGGLRYLQHGNLKRIRQSIRSRKIMQNVAPHLIKAVPFLVPTFGRGLKSKNIMRLALSVNDLISFNRNYNIAFQNRIPGGYVISREEILKLIPGINTEKFTGGAVWYEAVVQNTERMLLEFLYEANQYDFTAANYVVALEFINSDDGIKEVKVKDLINSSEFNISARVFVNAVGPWFNQIQKKLEFNKPQIKLTKAVNIIVRKNFFADYSVGLEGKENFSDTEALFKRGKRLFFFVPIQNYTMIGTTYKLYDGKVNGLEITKEDINEIIEEANYLFPSSQLTFDDVSFYHVGLVPMDEKSSAGSIQAERHSTVSEYSRNLFSIKSVKYTTAPVIAEEVVKKIKKKIKPSYSYKKEVKTITKNYSGNIPQVVAERLIKTYGSHCNKIFELINENKSYLNLISENPPIITAEIVYAIRNEMALTLKDVILRRTGMGMLECPSLESIRAVASIISQELGWDKPKEISEINNLLQVYSLLKKNVETAC
ncbi:MAG: hypothetical protein A2057_17605 [Ignavibacteria bacterium GWA2_35_9]|nr:MAG: hypothetical protein A2057_17605 [Ignavibacteria bacterium GWA2_35_9]OGU49782.1 MAG: hypothetical protein A2080_03970 [Ignavibacteria bacterium GWC2_36_12]